MNYSRTKLSPGKRLLWLAPLLWALSGHVMAEKIGYVDVRRLIDESPQGLMELKKLEDAFAERNREIQGDLDVFEDKRAALEKNAIDMSEEDVARETQELEQMQRTVLRDQRDYNEEYNESRNRSLALLQAIISDAVVHVARRDDFDLVVQQAVYVSDRINITELVLKELVQRSEQ